MLAEADAALRKGDAFEPFLPRRCFEWIPERQIECRFLEAGFGNLSRNLSPIVPRPAHQQPGRHIARHAIERLQDRRALGIDLAQHGVDQLLIALGLGIALGLRDGEIDGRVSGRAEKKELSGGAQQDQFGAARLARERALQKAIDHRAEAAAVA